jgi:hypothetical protein
VERLSVGDLVIIETPDTLTKNGSCSAHSVKWIGWSRVDLKRHPNPDLVRPVRIRANAIADGVPRRDLLVSPDHALFIDEKLIPARLLRNGMTIHEDFSCNTVIYYHVELDSHHVLLANGMPAESYLDTGNRSSFQNGGLPTMLHPNFNGLSDHECREARSCAPLVTGATCVEPVWRTVAGRAEALGFRPLAVEMTNDPALHILAEGKKITPISCINGQYLFILPALRGPVRLVSHSIAPSTLYPWVEDRRSLGVMIRHIIVRDGIDYDVIGADDPRLVDGWWASESDGGAIWRWTSGNAAIPIEGGAMIEVLVGRTLSYTAPSNDTDQEQALRLLRA